MGWFFFFLTIAAAIFFYWLRLKYRLAYGCFEILVALGLIYVAIFPAETHALLIQGPSPEDLAASRVTEAVTLFGAVYVFVRGLDNINTALPSSTWRSRWDRLKQVARRA
jgi:hypothetical protein